MGEWDLMAHYSQDWESLQYGGLSPDSPLKADLDRMACLQVVWSGRDAREQERKDLEE